MKARHGNLKILSIFLIVAALTAILLLIIIPPGKPLLNEAINEADTQMRQLNIVALGDSLTEGVGDSTNSGGYVPLLEKELSNTGSFSSVKIKNYGDAGDTTRDLINLIKGSDEMQRDISNSSMVVITIGANDLMKVVKGNLLNQLSVEMFDKPKQEYIDNLTELYTLLHELNPNAAIFQLGIYNPYYKVLGNITELHTVASDWNVSSDSVISKQENSFFVPVLEQMQEEDPTLDSLLSSEDNFHPNDMGYRVIAKTFRDKIMDTKDLWEEKVL